MSHKISIIYTTTSSQAKAEELGFQAIQNKLASCVNIVPKAISLYEWNGKIEKTEEYLMVFKTHPSKFEDLKQWIKQNHSYDVPAILSAHLDSNDDFYNYIQSRAVISKQV